MFIVIFLRIHLLGKMSIITYTFKNLIKTIHKNNFFWKINVLNNFNCAIITNVEAFEEKKIKIKHKKKKVIIIFVNKNSKNSNLKNVI